MDYFKRTHNASMAAFSMQKLMSIREYQEEYSEGLQSVPLVVMTAACGEYERDAVQCERERGQGDEECQSKWIATILCQSQFLVPQKVCFCWCFVGFCVHYWGAPFIEPTSPVFGTGSMC